MTTAPLIEFSDYGHDDARMQALQNEITLLLHVNRISVCCNFAVDKGQRYASSFCITNRGISIF